MGSYRRITGVVAEDKREVLDTCMVAWCKSGFPRRVLIEELRRAEIRGCFVIRISGATVLLMFATMEDRKALLDRNDLDRWFVGQPDSSGGYYDRTILILEGQDSYRNQ
ncbi:hypothetical protein V6N13_059386 [Hibiscus sabdariffa]